MTYHDRVLGLAAFWKLGAQAESVLQLLPESRRTAILLEVTAAQKSDPGAKLGELARKETRRVNRWGRRRFGTGWDRLDPRVRSRLVQENGRNH